jgi:D-alanine--poly(phosphoribitol) ligase subunit 1
MLEKIRDSIRIHADRKAFVIRDRSYTYHDFAKYISGIRQIIAGFKTLSNKIVAVYTDDSIETYAAIYAIWFEGLTFLPLNPRFPVTRNLEIIRQAGTGTILYSGINPPDEILDKCMNRRSVKEIYSENINLNVMPARDEDLLYILFTSGSTGVPKGVPISRKNLYAFTDAFLSNSYDFHADDRFLQMFDFTFDVSVQCYTVPLLFGACICTVSQDQIKYLAVYKVLENQKITVAVMVPSVIGFLRPYLKKVYLPGMRYTIFTGESVPRDLVEEWARCCPHSVIDDCYGPTEATIYCLSYRWKKESHQLKSYNSIVSIGKPFRGIEMVVLDDDGRPLSEGSKGELAVAGDQLTRGYLNNQEKNSTAFIEIEHENKSHIFYRTGDLVYLDDEGDCMYCGRLDYQVQVQGFRVELGEIEYQAGKVIQTGKCIAIAKPDLSGNMEIFLFVENNHDRMAALKKHLQSALPYYMQPVKLITLDTIPLNANGKTDRNKLLQSIPLL